MTPSERKKIVKDFFDKAEAKNLIIYKDRSQFSEITKRIIKERQEEAQTFQDFWDIFQTPKKLITLEQFILKKFNIKDKSTNFQPCDYDEKIMINSKNS